MKDEAEFREFVAFFGNRLLRTAFLLTGDRGHAEDLVQLALERTARRWSGLAGSPGVRPDAATARGDRPVAPATCPRAGSVRRCPRAVDRRRCGSAIAAAGSCRSVATVA